MKKLVVLMLVLAVASMASASMVLNISGGTDPLNPLKPSDVVTISVTAPVAAAPGTYYMGLLGPASLDLAGAQMVYAGNQAAMFLDTDPGVAEALAIQVPFLNLAFDDLPPVGTAQKPVVGLLVSGIKFHCDAEGDVLVILTNGDGEVLDSATIYQIPEPMTIGLLGLGGLFLRRRMA